MQTCQLTKYSVDLLKRADQRTSSPTWSLFSCWVCLKCRFSANKGTQAVVSFTIVVAISFSIALSINVVNEPDFAGLTDLAEIQMSQ